MKLFTVTLYKLKMMLSDRLFFTAMIAIPLLITIATGYALRHEKLNVIPVAFVDEDGSNYSREVIERLSKKEGLEILVSARDEALEMLQNNKVEEVFVIKEGFEEKIVLGDNEQIIDMVKSPYSFSADFVGEVVAGEVMRFVAGNMAAQRVSEKYASLGKPAGRELAEEVLEHVDSQWEPEPLMTIDYKEMEGSSLKDVKRVSMPAATASSVGVIVVFIMFYILFSSGWLIEERRNGTLKRLVAGPGALGYSFFGSICALVLSGMLQMLLFSVINRLVFGVDLFPSTWSYAVFFSYLLSVISISMFLSSVLKTPAQLQAGAPVLALITGFAGGCFWNFVEVPESLRRLSMLTPQGWALKGINTIVLNPGEVAAIIQPMAVLLALSLVLLPLSYFIISKSVRS